MKETSTSTPKDKADSAAQGSVIISPAIRSHPNLNPPYTEMGWCSLREVHLMAKQHAAALPPEKRFEITDNIGEFMRRYWVFCEFSASVKDLEVPFCHSGGTITLLGLRDACRKVNKDIEAEEAGVPPANEHELFKAMEREGTDLLIPALFGKLIKAAVRQGGDAVYSCPSLITHTTLPMCHGVLFVRLAQLSKRTGQPVYAIYDSSWEKTSKT